MGCALDEQDEPYHIQQATSAKSFRNKSSGVFLCLLIADMYWASVNFGNFFSVINQNKLG